METLETWIEAREHVDINTLANEDRFCGICYKTYQSTSTKGVDIKIKDTQNKAEGSERCIAPIKISCGHIMGSTCLLKWLKPYPFGGNGNSCPLCRDIFFAPRSQELGSENHVARGIDNGRIAGDQNAQQQQDVASSGNRRQEEEQDSDEERWVEDRWGGYDDWDQDDEGDSFWRRIDAPR